MHFWQIKFSFPKWKLFSFANLTYFSEREQSSAMSLNFSAGRRMAARDLDGTYIFESTGRVDYEASEPRRHASTSESLGTSLGCHRDARNSSQPSFRSLNEPRPMPAIYICITKRVFFHITQSFLFKLSHAWKLVLYLYYVNNLLFIIHSKEHVLNYNLNYK